MAIEDIIWGKNRHVFGGIEPSNMIEFSVELGNNAVLIKATPPQDTVVDDQTICTVAGVVIRRGLNFYPKDEFDGDEVVTIYGSDRVLYNDIYATIDGTYYYAAFPFSAQGVYNRNVANRAVYNEPDNMVQFTTTPRYDKSNDKLLIDITYTLPETVAGAIIRVSTEGYPTNTTDGDLVLDVPISGAYPYGRFTGESLVEGVTYYFSAFTYTSTGAYNYDPSNRDSATVKKCTYYYGYDIVLSNSDPDARVTYQVDDSDPVDNLGFTPAGIRYDTGLFTYGSWENAGFIPKPCMLKYDGTVAYYLDPNDYSKKEDGTGSDVSSLDFEGNAMMEWPKIWTKRWESTDGNGDTRYHFRCSDIKIDNDYECWCNYDRNGDQIDHFYTSIYRGYESYKMNGVNVLRSISGTTSSINITIQSLFEYAANNGDDWTAEVFADRLLINDLLVLIGHSTNGEGSFGVGSTLDWYGNECGLTDAEGLFNGVANKTDTTSSLKIFGMEDWWGHGYRVVHGWIECSNNVFVKMTRGTKDGSTTSDYNLSGAGYVTLHTDQRATTDIRFIAECVTKPYGRFAYNNHTDTTRGSATSYECDHFYRYGINDDPKFLMVGMRSSANPSGDGPFCMSILSNAKVDSYGNSIRTGLSCKPCVKEV